MPPGGARRGAGSPPGPQRSHLSSEETRAALMPLLRPEDKRDGIPGPLAWRDLSLRLGFNPQRVTEGIRTGLRSGTIEKWAEQLKNPLPDDLDVGIRRTVALLRRAGFVTCDSGDGRSKEEDARTFEGPHVIMAIDGSPIEEAHRLLQVVTDAGITVGEQGPPGAVAIQANYCPVSEKGILCLLGLDDDHLSRARARRLKRSGR